MLSLTFGIIMTHVPFSVSARTAQLIGQQNFSTADGAVVELVKNCYDADSGFAIVLFDNSSKDSGDHSLFIIDNGIGMDREIIINHWMRIGTDNKEENFETETGRVKTGAKGIGRFALDRLGELAEMYTLPSENTTGNFWKVDWNDFKQKGVSISDVKAILEPIPEFDLSSKIKDLIGDFLPLQNYITERNFDLSHGTIIKISRLKEPWTSDELSKLYENLEILIPPLEQPVFNIALFSKNAPEDFGDLSSAYYDDFDYKVSAKYLDDKTESVNITIERNEFDPSKVRKEYKEVFSMPLMQKFPFDEASFLADKIEFPIKLSELVKGQHETDTENLLSKIGKFGFTFYFLKNTRSDDKSESDLKKYPYKSFNSATRRAWLRKFGGVKIFRDDFRVRPYGENGQDWLKLGERQAQSPQGAGQRLGAYRIGPNQISGTINISRLTNLNFQDKSGREGIQENDVFELFKSVIIGLIGVFERDRNIVMFSFSELNKKLYAEAEQKRRADEETERILKEEEDRRKREAAQSERNTDEDTKNEPTIQDPEPGPSPSEVALATGYKIQKQEIEEKDNEIRLLRSLSGTGLIVSSFAHELRSLRALLVSRTDDLKKVLENNLDPETVKDLASYENPFNMLNHMRDQDVQIKHWLDYSLSALKKDKRTRTNLDVFEYLNSFKASWDNALKRRKVSLSIQNNLRKPISIRAFAIDFDTVFNNLLINSLDSFKRLKNAGPRNVEILVDSTAEAVRILFCDNGAGLSKDFEKQPNDIFLPFETSKVDRKGIKVGTGIGMYLVKTIAEDYKGEIEIIETKDGFKLGLYIPIMKYNK
jgi:signal transduction histidine kinase